MAFKLDLLNSAAAIVEPRSGKPNAQFILFWQRQVKTLEAQEKAQQDLLAMIQQQQEVIVQLLAVVAQNVAYLNSQSAWLQNLGEFVVERVAYLQICVATLAANTGTELPPPDPPLPDYPGPPPTPPWDEP